MQTWVRTTSISNQEGEVPVGEKPRKLTLYQPVAYQIKVPGHMDSGAADWFGDMVLRATFDGHRQPVTMLTGLCDQAALLGLLRRLNSLGLPIISVICREDEVFS